MRARGITKAYEIFLVRRGGASRFNLTEIGFWLHCAIVHSKNESLSDMLAHLAELDERGLCLELGYSSLFAYCVEALGFCKSSAGRRIAAARVCRKYPAAFARVANGELGLSVLVELNKHLTAENASELLAACSHQSYEQVELLLAARFPKPDVRDLVRRLPATRSAPDIGCGVAGEAMSTGAASVPSTPSAVSQEPAARAPVASPPERTQRAGIVKPLSPERFSVNFTADAEFHDLLEEVRALVSHAEPRGDLLNVMKRGLQALKIELLKKRYGVGRKPRRVSVRQQGTGLATRTRYIAADVSRAAWERDGRQCTFCSAEGKRCSARSFLQLDHVHPYALGGRATLGNLRLRCRSHKSAHGAGLLWREVHARSLRRARSARRNASGVVRHPGQDSSARRS